MRTGNEVWLDIGEEELRYHRRQYREPYRSTVAFIDFLKRAAGLDGEAARTILDVGTGAGANVFWMAKAFPKCAFTGIDLSPELVGIADELNRGDENRRFLAMDYHDIPSLPKFDHVLSFQFLSWIDMAEADRCLALQFRQAERGVGATSLFCDHGLDYEIKVHDRFCDRLVHYNIYSIDRLRELADGHGFSLKRCERFDIDIDLPATEKGLGSYTLPLADGKRLQCSGSMNMPWHFLYFEKKAGVAPPKVEP